MAATSTSNTLNHTLQPLGNLAVYNNGLGPSAVKGYLGAGSNDVYTSKPSSIFNRTIYKALANAPIFPFVLAGPDTTQVAIDVAKGTKKVAVAVGTKISNATTAAKKAAQGAVSSVTFGLKYGIILVIVIVVIFFLAQAKAVLRP